MNTEIKLYQAEWCPYCQKVRMHMTELGLNYHIINVPRNKQDRTKLIEISNQPGIPTLVDGDTIIAGDDDKIIEYLNEKYVNKKGS